ncbi:SAV_915 family protein [Actinacidiphila oryziradicis]|uniref:SAV_915 family protein n=1 Tax=Actinacidiphila oryziradicis TaxID=2571141 RepID=UPI0023F51091|nr:SAV_915 family protein [Actinacidiphila oryziradicis]MCW2870877.1 hypothetical protein [Actinacidiphila oryziradicis]
MSQYHLAEDPEPSEPVPAGLLFVPVRPGPMGCTARFFRTPLGGRTAVGFTTERRLIATLGIGQACIRLSAPALRALATPLGIAALTVDPQLTAPAARDRVPRSIDVLRVTGAPAVVSGLKPLIG